MADQPQPSSEADQTAYWNNALASQYDTIHTASSYALNPTTSMAIARQPGLTSQQGIDYSHLMAGGLMAQGIANAHASTTADLHHDTSGYLNGILDTGWGMAKNFGLSHWHSLIDPWNHWFGQGGSFQASGGQIGAAGNIKGGFSIDNVAGGIGSFISNVVNSTIGNIPIIGKPSAWIVTNPIHHAASGVGKTLDEINHPTVGGVGDMYDAFVPADFRSPIKGAGNALNTLTPIIDNLAHSWRYFQELKAAHGLAYALGSAQTVALPAVVLTAASLGTATPEASALLAESLGTMAETVGAATTVAEATAAGSRMASALAKVKEASQLPGTLASKLTARGEIVGRLKATLEQTKIADAQMQSSLNNFYDALSEAETLGNEQLASKLIDDIARVHSDLKINNARMWGFRSAIAASDVTRPAFRTIGLVTKPLGKVAMSPTMNAIHAGILGWSNADKALWAKSADGNKWIDPNTKMHESFGQSVLATFGMAPPASGVGPAWYNGLTGTMDFLNKMVIPDPLGAAGQLVGDIRSAEGLGQAGSLLNKRFSGTALERQTINKQGVTVDRVDQMLTQDSIRIPGTQKRIGSLMGINSTFGRLAKMTEGQIREARPELAPIADRLGAARSPEAVAEVFRNAARVMELRTAIKTGSIPTIPFYTFNRVTRTNEGNLMERVGKLMTVPAPADKLLQRKSFALRYNAYVARMVDRGMQARLMFAKQAISYSEAAGKFENKDIIPGDKSSIEAMGINLIAAGEDRKVVQDMMELLHGTSDPSEFRHIWNTSVANLLRSRTQALMFDPALQGVAESLDKVYVTLARQMAGGERFGMGGPYVNGETGEAASKVFTRDEFGFPLETQAALTPKDLSKLHFISPKEVNRAVRAVAGIAIHANKELIEAVETAALDAATIEELTAYMKDINFNRNNLLDAIREGLLFKGEKPENKVFAWMPKEGDPVTPGTISASPQNLERARLGGIELILSKAELAFLNSDHFIDGKQLSKIFQDLHADALQTTFNDLRMYGSLPDKAIPVSEEVSAELYAAAIQGMDQAPEKIRMLLNNHLGGFDVEELMAKATDLRNLTRHDPMAPVYEQVRDIPLVQRIAGTAGGAAKNEKQIFDRPYRTKGQVWLDSADYWVNRIFFAIPALLTPGWAERVSLSEMLLNSMRFGPVTYGRAMRAAKLASKEWHLTNNEVGLFGSVTRGLLMGISATRLEAANQARLVEDAFNLVGSNDGHMNLSGVDSVHNRYDQSVENMAHYYDGQMVHLTPDHVQIKDEKGKVLGLFTRQNEGSTAPQWKYSKVWRTNTYKHNDPYGMAYPDDWHAQVSLATQDPWMKEVAGIIWNVKQKSREALEGEFGQGYRGRRWGQPESSRVHLRGREATPMLYNVGAFQTEYWQENDSIYTQVERFLKSQPDSVREQFLRNKLSSQGNNEENPIRSWAEDLSNHMWSLVHNALPHEREWLGVGHEAQQVLIYHEEVLRQIVDDAVQSPRDFAHYIEHGFFPHLRTELMHRDLIDLAEHSPHATDLTAREIQRTPPRVKALITWGDVRNVPGWQEGQNIPVEITEDAAAFREFIESEQLGTMFHGAKHRLPPEILTFRNHFPPDNNVYGPGLYETTDPQTALGYMVADPKEDVKNGRSILSTQPQKGVRYLSLHDPLSLELADKVHTFWVTDHLPKIESLLRTIKKTTLRNEFPEMTEAQIMEKLKAAKIEDLLTRDFRHHISEGLEEGYTDIETGSANDEGYNSYGPSTYKFHRELRNDLYDAIRWLDSTYGALESHSQKIADIVGGIDPQWLAKFGDDPKALAIMIGERLYYDSVKPIQDAGYDGFAHIGGNLTRNDRNHVVTVTFQPNKTRKIMHVEQVDDHLVEQDLRTYGADQKKGDVMFAPETVGKRAFASHELPQKIVAQDIDTNFRLDKTIQRVSDFGHAKFLGPIVNRLSRQPTFLLDYHREMNILRRRIQNLQEGKITTNALTEKVMHLTFKNIEEREAHKWPTEPLDDGKVIIPEAQSHEIEMMPLAKALELAGVESGKNITNDPPLYQMKHLSEDGFQKPIEINYYAPSDQPHTAHIDRRSQEGYNLVLLDAAQQLGLTHVPVSVLRGDWIASHAVTVSGYESGFNNAPASVRKVISFDRPMIPSRPLASDIGLTAHDPEDLVINGDLTKEQAVQLAHERAVRQTIRFVHNPQDKTNFEASMSAVAPFYFAQMQAWRRAARLFLNNPGKFEQYMKASLAVTNYIQGATSSNGPILMIPGSQLMGAGVGMLASGMGWKLGLVAGSGGLKSAIPTGIVGGGVKGLMEAIMPSFGPLVTVPVKALGHVVQRMIGTDDPKDQAMVEKAMEIVLGPISARTPLWGDFIPNSMLRNAVVGIVGSSSAGNSLATSMSASWANAQVSSLNSYMQAWFEKEARRIHENQPSMPMSGVWNTAYANWGDWARHNQTQILADVHKGAVMSWIARSAAQAFMPFSLWSQDQGVEFNKKLLDDVSKYGLTEGFAHYEKNNPDHLLSETMKTASPYGSVSYSEKSWKWMSENPEAVAKYPRIMPYLLPRNDTSFSPQAFAYELATGLRTRQTPADALNSMLMIAGNHYFYDELKPAVDAYKQQLLDSGHNEASAGYLASQMETKNADAFGQAYNPYWADHRKSFQKKADAVDALKQLENLIKDKSVPMPDENFRQNMDTVYKSFVSYNDQYKQAETNNDKSTMSAVKTAWWNYTDQISKTNKTVDAVLRGVYYRIPLGSI